MAGLSVSEELLRFVFIVANIILWGIGVSLTAVGIYSIVSVRDYEEFDVSYITNGSGVLIALGLLIFIVGFLGCYGAFSKSACMLYGFGVFLFILFCVEVSMGFYLLKNKDAAMEVFEKSLKKSMEQYSTDKPTKRAWDHIQRGFRCCGTSGPASWNDTLGSGNVPDSCCVNNTVGCGTGYPDSGVAIFYDLCVHEVEAEINRHVLVMALVAIILGMLHWFGIVIACCLGNVFKQFQSLESD